MAKVVGPSMRVQNVIGTLGGEFYNFVFDQAGWCMPVVGDQQLYVRSRKDGLWDVEVFTKMGDVWGNALVLCLNEHRVIEFLWVWNNHDENRGGGLVNRYHEEEYNASKK